MKKLRVYLRNIFTVFVIFIYSFVMLFQNIPFFKFINKVKAESAGNKINLVGIFVDGNIYNKIKDDISWYTYYIQKTNKNTKAIVLPINVNSISSLDLLKVIDNLYYYGEKEKTSFLKSIVLIGNIPLPVVNKDNYIYKSIYPYVDIVKPEFVYDRKTGYFEYNHHPSDVELSHGIIKFNNINGYKNYFKKLKSYASNPSNFVDKGFYLDNFVSQSSSFNHNIVKYYLNKLLFAENLVTKKITPLLLKYFNKQNNASYDKLFSKDSDKSTKELINEIGKDSKIEKIDGVFADILGFNGPEVKKFSSIQDQYKNKLSNYFKNMKDMFSDVKMQTNPYGQMPTLMLESSLKNFFRDYIQLFGNQYGGTLTDNLKATGRYDWNNTVSSLNAVDIKDHISINYLRTVNKFLEKSVDNQIQKEDYYMNFPLMVYYTTDVGSCNEKKYENFYFGKNAININSLEDLHIFRGTFGNFTSTDILKDIDSRGKKSNTSMMNNLFDIQTISNRGYNVMLSEKDGNDYKNICSKTENGSCTNLGRKYNSEDIKNWSKRIYGGYSPLNIDPNLIQKDPYNIQFSYSNYKDAWNPSYAPSKNGSLFNLGGTIVNKNRESTAYTDTINGAIKYSSVFETEHYKSGFFGGDGENCEKVYDDGYSRKVGRYYDFSAVCKGDCPVDREGGLLKVKDGDNVYAYKFIDTRIKHISPTDGEFEGFNLSTKARPVDSKNYITFFGVGLDAVRFDYPDIYSIDVYKKEDKKLVLKTPSEIDNTIKDYLRSVVLDYNKKLETELNKTKENVSYSLFPETYLIDTLGEEKISQISEMLYYLNLGWKEKPIFSDLSGELDYLYTHFNVNEKISYIVKKNLNVEDEDDVGGNDISKSKLNFPLKPSKGYEAGLLASNNMDDLTIGNFNLNNTYNKLLGNKLIGENNLLLDVNEKKKECGRPLGEGVILWKWPAAFICRLKETLKKPFKIGTTSACVIGTPLKSLESILHEQEEKSLEQEDYYDSLGKSEEYDKLKSIVDNKFTVKTDKSTYSYNDLTGDIRIINYTNMNELEDPIENIYIKSPQFTGNQFFIDGKSTWVEGNGIQVGTDRWKIPFSFYNLKTGEGRYYSYKAGERIFNVTFCTKDNICYTKQVVFDKSAGNLKYVDIKPFSDVMVYGGEDPFVIRGFDSKPNSGKYQNKIDGSIWSYKLYLDPGIGNIRSSIGLKGRPSIDYNFSSSNELMSVKSNTEPLPGIKFFNIKLQIDDKWKDLIESDIVKSASKKIEIASKKVLDSSDLQIVSNSQLLHKLPSDPYSFITGDDNYQTYDKSKLLKIHIEPKVYGKTLKTPLTVKNKNKNFIVGTFQKTTITVGDKTIIYDKFVKNNQFLIKNDNGIDVYLLPTYKTGPYTIDISIPGIQTYTISGKIQDFPIKDVYVVLDKYRAKPGEIVSGKVFGVDKFGNLQDNINGVSIVPSSGISVHRNGNEIKIVGTKSGFISFIAPSGNKNVINFGVEGTFIPINDKISVMYLTLLGYKWGKYAEKIMSHSAKNLAITTTLYDPSTIKKYDYIIKQNLKTNNPVELLLDGNKTIFNFGTLKVNYIGNVFSNIKEVKSISNVNSNGIFYIKEATDDIIKTNYIANNILYINNIPVINFKRNTKEQYVSILSNSNYGEGVYDIFVKKHKVGSIILNESILDLHKLTLDKPFIIDIIPGNASSNGLKALGISISNNEYKWISSNTKIDVIGDKGLGFRSNFRNITDFAAGLNVGDASKSFENEFMINYGDPFIKRISSQETIPEVSMSKTYGYRIYSSIAGGIQKVVPIDFNNDGLKDIAILYKNGNIRLLKNYKGADSFEDLGNLMVLGKPVKNMFAGDYNGDGYKDLFIVFTDNTVRVYTNIRGEFAVNPYPVCLDVTGANGMYFKTDQIFFRDMNNDKKTDIVVNDLASNVKVFFGPTYVSKSIYKCSGVHLKQKLVKSYSYKITDKKFIDDGYIYWEGFNDNSTLLKSKIRKAFKNNDFDNIPKDGSITPDTYSDKVGPSGAEKFSTQDIPKVLGPSYVKITGDSIAFKKATFLTGSDPVDVYKTMEDLNGGSLILGDKVRVTVHINNKLNKKITYLELLKGPFAVISKNDKPILKFNNIPSSKVKIPLNYPEFLFQVDDYNKSFSISYEAYFQGSSSVKIKVDDFTKNNYGDIKVFLKNGCIKGYDYFKGKHGNPMNFDYEYIDLSEKLKDKVAGLDTTNTIADTTKEIESGKYKDLLGKFKISTSDDIWGSNKYNKLAGGSTNLDIDIGPNIDSIRSKITNILNGLCGGFSFGKAGCGGVPVPCNFAFFAPGIINACGCPLGIDPGIPVFFTYGTRWTSHGPIPVPNGLEAFPADWFIWPQGGVFPSFFRLYVSPTLTAGLGVAACFGSYSVGMESPTAPVGAIAGNCIVVAGDLPMPKCSKKDKNNADDQLDDWMNDLDNGICSSLPVNVGKYPSSSVIIPNAGSFVNSNISAGGTISGLNGLVKFTMNAHKINSLGDAGVLMEGGIPFNLHIETGTFKGLISCIIKKWRNKQIEFTINQLTQMTIYVTYPDMDGFLDGFTEKNWAHFNYNGFNLSKVLGDFALGKSGRLANSDLQETLSKYLPSKKGLKTLGKELSNPFRAVKDYFNDVPLINVHLKTTVIRVPWIGKDEVEKQIAYLESWEHRQKDIIQKWKAYIDGFDGKCDNKECQQAYASILKVNSFINSVKKNIRILNEYKNFPLKLYKYVHLLDFYLSQIACIIDKYVDMIVGWLNRNSKIFQRWVDAIITMINIIKTWQILIDISLNWKTTCGKCRMDNGDLYDCILSGLCINLPILPIPPFRIPDIFVDFSHINLGVDIVLPKIKIYPVPIGKFTLPNLPEPSVTIELPPVPLLQEPPILDDLPSLPPVPTVELPNLPPPPIIPKILPSIKVMLKVFELVSYFRCIIKNGIGFVAEWNVKTRIEQLTARKNRLFPFDFLNIDYPLLPWAGFNVRVDAYLKYRVEFSQVFDAINNIVKNINKKTGVAIDNMIELNLKTQKSLNKFQLDSDKFHLELKKQSFVFPKQNKRFVKVDFNKLIVNDKPVSTKVAKGLLFNELSYLLSQKGKDYMNSISNSMYKKAEEIQNNTLHKAKVFLNIKGIYDIQGKIKELLRTNKNYNSKILSIIDDMENGKKLNLNSDIFYKTGNNLVDYQNNNEKHIIYKIDLFKIDKKSQSIIDNSENPKLSYLKMYKKSLYKFVEKTEKYKNGKPKKYYQYKELENSAKRSLNVINYTLGDKIAYTSEPASSSSRVNILADPSQYIKGLYMRGTDNIYYNVLNDKKKAQKIRKKKTYMFEDINNDGKKDMIWYDNNSVYIKYSKDEPENNGIIISKRYIYSNIINNFEDIVDKDGFISLNGDTFKIWDIKGSVNDLKLKYSNASEFKLGWTNDENVNSYTIIYTSRIDILNDIETKYNYAQKFLYAGNSYKKYAVIIYDKKLGNINEIKASKINISGVYKKVFIPVDFTDKDKLSIIFNKSKLELDNKWKYFRMYKSYLNIEINKLKLLSSYSNQEVGATQIIGDETDPYITVALRRTNLKPNKIKSNIIGTGTKLYGFVNTAYTIEGKWIDNVGVKSKWITDKKFNFIKNGDILYLTGFSKPIKKVYYFMAEDYNKNIAKIKVSLNIGIPDIKIDDVNEDAGIVSSSISSSMDHTAVKFGVQTKNGIKIINNINGKSIFTGGVLDTYFTGAVFNNEKKIIFYGNDSTKIGSLDLTDGEISLYKPDYYVLGDVSSGKLIYNVYNKNEKKMFSIYLPPKKQITAPIVHKTGKFGIKKINNINLGDFDGGYCIYDKIANVCSVYITKNGIVYVSKNYRDYFVTDYNINQLGVISSTFYNISVPNKSLITKDKKIFTIFYKTKDMSK